MDFLLRFTIYYMLIALFYTITKIKRYIMLNVNVNEKCLVMSLKLGHISNIIYERQQFGRFKLSTGVL